MDKSAAADVGPRRQRTQYTCMTTSMAMCLHANGMEATEDEVNKVMGAKPMQGASWEQAFAAAQHYGMRVTFICPATLKQIKEYTDRGVPVMIAWNPEGRPWSHASVVFDVDDEMNVSVADPNIPDPDETVRMVTKTEFYGKWYEKWPDYMVRRPAMAVEREVTTEGRQMVASQKTSSDELTLEFWSLEEVTLRDVVNEDDVSDQHPNFWTLAGLVKKHGKYRDQDYAFSDWLEKKKNLKPQYASGWYIFGPFPEQEWENLARQYGANKKRRQDKSAMNNEQLASRWLMAKKSPQNTTKTQDEKRREQNKVTIDPSTPRSDSQRKFIEDRAKGTGGAGVHKNRDKAVEDGRSRKEKHKKDWTEKEACLTQPLSTRPDYGSPESFGALFEEARQAAYDGNPDGEPIYPKNIDHGVDTPLSGGTDVVQQLQNDLLDEQGNSYMKRKLARRFLSQG